jgi:hypothetical protein
MADVPTRGGSLLVISRERKGIRAVARDERGLGVARWPIIRQPMGIECLVLGLGDVWLIFARERRSGMTRAS